MKKIIITLSILLIIIVGIIVWKIGNGKNEEEPIKQKTTVSEKVTDECVEEYDNNTTIETNYDKEKISPNCLFILKKYYKKCNHTINEYIEIPEEIINKTEDELKEEYEGWKIEKFSSNEVILYKEYEGDCGEHYILKEKDGKIVIYRETETGEQEEYEETQISTEYLTETDKINISKGIRVYGKEALNQIIEDFE